MPSIELPDDPTLSQIREAVAKHHVDEPTHGVGCSCLDSVIRIVRKQLKPLAYNYEAQNRRSYIEQKGAWALEHAVVSAVTRG